MVGQVDVRRADAIFRGVVARLCAEWRVNRKVFADDSGFSEPHLRRILNDPGSARLCDIRGMADAFDDLTDADLIAIVRGVRP